MKQEDCCFKEAQVAYIIHETLKGIDYFHKSSMIHRYFFENSILSLYVVNASNAGFHCTFRRDIKADRILLNSEFQVKITDFRISSVNVDVSSRVIL
jgi:serine/threonine protein kinase